jgi:hypothetical protein
MKTQLGIVHPAAGTVCAAFSGGVYKLQLIFILIDVLILVAYPFVFVAGKVRQFLKVKR